MSLFKFAVSVVAEMLTISEIDPYREKWEPPQVTGTRKDASGGTVLEVKAHNYRDVGRLTDGVTVSGKQIVQTHVGRHKWEISAERPNASLDDHRNAQDKKNGGI